MSILYPDDSRGCRQTLGEFYISPLSRKILVNCITVINEVTLKKEKYKPHNFCGILMETLKNKMLFLKSVIFAYCIQRRVKEMCCVSFFSEIDLKVEIDEPF